MSQAAVVQRSSVPFLQTASENQDSPEVSAQAKAISDQIDALIADDRARRKARKDAGDMSLLLLGQSESGKSTLLKQFQLMHSQTAFDEERVLWKPVILLNVLNTVRNVLNIIKEERAQNNNYLEDNESIQNLQNRSKDLVSCEETLVGILVNTGHIQASNGSATTSKNVYMRRRAGSRSRSSVDGRSGNGLTALSSSDQTSLQDIAKTLTEVKYDIQAVWGLQQVQNLVKDRLQEDWRRYFIGHLSRIIEPTYTPTDDDILHVRIMTMGVVEHTFKIVTPGSSLPFKRGGNKEINMHIYDVGGARGQRHAWASYFDEATAIIFMAPISAFDQYLLEDPEINRIQDSLELFQKICENRMLSKVEIVLFLNKVDLLESKLRDGVMIKDFISSYGTQENSFKVAQKFFSTHFQGCFLRSTNKIDTDSKRSLFIHFTSVVDTKTTRIVISNVQDAILKSQLRDAKLM